MKANSVIFLSIILLVGSSDNNWHVGRMTVDERATLKYAEDAGSKEVIDLTRNVLSFWKTVEVQIQQSKIIMKIGDKSKESSYTLRDVGRNHKVLDTDGKDLELFRDDSGIYLKISSTTKQSGKEIGKVEGRVYFEIN